MDITLADQYYLKAENAFPWKMDTAIENLSYALSYEDTHVQSLCLLGKLYMFYLKDYELASSAFNRALQADLNYRETYKYFTVLKIWSGDLRGAEQLARYAFTVKGMDVPVVLAMKALIFEAKGEYKAAKAMLKQARQLSLNCATRDWIKSQHSRVKDKYVRVKSQSKKRKKKAKA